MDPAELTTLLADEALRSWRLSSSAVQACYRNFEALARRIASECQLPIP